MTGVILAGGKSARMKSSGFNVQGGKAFLKFGEASLIQSVIGVLTRIFNDVIIVAAPENRDFYLEYSRGGKISVETDILPGNSALGGIYTGILLAKTEHIFAVSCDMPFLNAKLIRYMKDNAEDYDAVAPYSGGRYEPLHAVYSKRCAEVMLDQIKNGNLRINDIFKKVKTKEIGEIELNRIDPAGRSFFNVNTGEDYGRALGMLKASL